MTWKEVQEEAAQHNIWILDLGKDSLGTCYATAGPSSIITSINKQLLIAEQKQIEHPSEIPYQLILELKLPLFSGEDLVEIAKAAYLEVLSKLG